jgi:sugar transferase EpsL
MALKRAVDLFLTIPALILSSPLILVLWIAVRMNLGKPALFRQLRPGYKGKPFTLLKFRTMSDARDSSGNLLPDSERLTRFGAFLRSSSLDELPELLNVVRGDMSLVGPRPLLMQYLGRYNAEQMRRHDVLPGITGWAQINGRNDISWEEKFKLDVWYVQNRSLSIDLKILGMTIWKAITREGVTQKDRATVDEFRG